MDQRRQQWTEPGAFEVAEGVFRIPLPLPQDGLRAVNVYAIVSGSQLVMIDGGWAVAEARATLDRALADLGCEVADVTRFLVTHVHRDHYSQALALRQEFGTDVSLGLGEASSLIAMRDPERQPNSEHARLRRCGADSIADALDAHGHDDGSASLLWEDPDDWLLDGTRIDLDDRSLTVVATPGHTQGHVVFIDEDRHLLFAGDHVLPHITPSIGFEAVQAALPLGDYLRSLATLRGMPDMALLPAHGPTGEGLHTRIDDLVAHHEERLQASYATVSAGPTTAFESAQDLRWTRRGLAFKELDLFNQVLATYETAAHLDLLVAKGLLAVERADGVDGYRTQTRTVGAGARPQ